MPHPTSEKPLYFVSDPSHAIKKICSSLGSPDRLIQKSYDGKCYQVSLNLIKNLWLKFQNDSGLNTFSCFSITDFEKTSYQEQRVGPCIKVLGRKTYDMIAEALRRKEVCEQQIIHTSYDGVRLGIQTSRTPKSINHFRKCARCFQDYMTS